MTMVAPRIRDRVEHLGSVERHDLSFDHARLWFYVDHARRLVDVASIRVPRRHRGQGEAGRALRHVLDLADDLHYDVKLDASPLDDRTHPERLARWYESYGFRRTGETVNPLGHPRMLRAARDLRRRRYR
jgi:hypothetical protein